MSRDTRVRSGMVDLKVINNDSTLEDYLKSEYSLPISVFYKTSLAQAITDAKDFLYRRKGGTVYIPAQNNEVDTLIVAKLLSNGRIQFNYEVFNYRYPINKESRPHTNDDWQVGDIVRNTDVTVNHNISWVCLEAGTPGVWGVAGYVRKWASEVEELPYLPDPSPLQLNRQLVVNGRSYICKLVNGEYNWYWQDMAYGASNERPTANLRPGLPYFNTETQSPEWYNGKGWSGVASQSFLEKLIWDEFESVKMDFYKVFGVIFVEEIAIQEYAEIFETDLGEILDHTTTMAIILEYEKIFGKIDINSQSTTEYDMIMQYMAVFGVDFKDPTALTPEDIDRALSTEWLGYSSPDPTAMSSEDVARAISTPWNNEVSEDLTAMDDTLIRNAIAAATRRR